MLCSGPYQEIATSLPMDSPELQFGIFVYDLGTMLAEQTLTVKGITIENEGMLSGVEHLVIGPNGVIILRLVIYLVYCTLGGKGSKQWFKLHVKIL